MIARVMLAALLTAAPFCAAAAQQPTMPIPAPAPALPDELVLKGDNIITVLVNGVPVRLEVTSEAFGPPIINPDLAADLMLIPEFQRGWRFGPAAVEGRSARVLVDFGAGGLPLAMSWSDFPVSDKADGIIGPHYLPHRRVTMVLRPTGEGERVQRFAMKRSGGSGNQRLGAEVTVGKKQLVMIFVNDRAENLITAPTANFIATHQEGGFLPNSDGIAVMNFGIQRPTRIMRIAEPIMLGELAVDRFAVRVEDYGDPKRVGEIGANDPRFAKNRILVSRRKGRGTPDLLTRLGRDQIAHCSRLTYDMALGEIRLSCGPAPE